MVSEVTALNLELLPSDVVFMASGQGSQKPGMGVSLLEEPAVAETFACASDVLGRDIAALVKDEGESAAATLNETRNAQAAIAALSIGVGRTLMDRGVVPAAILGFSLGQISALALASMVSVEDAFRIISARSEAMAMAASNNPGVMSALLRAEEAGVRQVCENCAQGDVLEIANYNAPGQIVIAGTPEAVARAEAAWAERGGKASRLATQGAFHSPLMEEATEPFQTFLASVDFDEPAIPVVCNTDGCVLAASDVRERLVAHLTNPVRFAQSVEALQARGAKRFVEVGFGGVLMNLIKRIDRDADRVCIQDKDSLENFLASEGA